MSLIRVGFIGLSASGSWAAGSHYPYLKDSTKFRIVALCNSSKEAAQAAKEKYNLPATTKTYDSPADLAADPDIDLVVCSVRVDKHYETLKPCVEAGKDCFVEWPLASNLQDAQELARLSKEKGCRTMVGLQARQSPVVKTVKNLVDSGKVGKVLSSTVVSVSPNRADFWCLAAMNAIRR